MVAELTGGRGIRHQASGDERFHDVIVEQAANPHLTRTLMPLRSLVRRYGGAVVGHYFATEEQLDRLLAVVSAAAGYRGARI
jgi:DNA-binding GntR family transcriptional regulator